MAATEASTEPVQGDTVDTKAEAEPTNVEIATAPAEEAQTTTEAPQSAEQPADSKAKPASEKIWDSFLNKSGLGKVMGGKKKKEQSTGAEDAVGDEQEKTATLNQPDQGEAVSPNDQATSESADTTEATTEGQAKEKAPDDEEEKKEPGAKPKQGEKSSVKDFIRKPVARIFSHRSTEKKDGTGEVRKHSKVRSKSLDRLQDADASTVVVDQIEDPQAADEPDKSASQTVKHMKRWHSFKKLMAQKSHKKSTEESKEAEGGEGASTEAPGDTAILDTSAKSEQGGQKRWKLKRSWTFQGLKRDSSVIGIHKPKGSDKDSTDNLKEERAAEEDQGATTVSEESKAVDEGETQDKSAAEGEEEKGATAASQRGKSVDQHANEIWTSFKKRVIPKSKKATDAGGGDEEPTGEQEQTDEPQAGKDSGKTAKAKRTHFNRAVSLKNFILRKGKSSSMDMGEGAAAQKEDDDTGEGDAKDDPMDGPTDTAGAADLPQGAPEGQAAAPSDSNNGAQVAASEKGSNGEEKPLASIPSGQQSDTPHVADPASGGGGLVEPAAEPKANGENGCSDAVSEDTTAHNHEMPSKKEGAGEEPNQENINSSGKTCSSNATDGKIMNQDGKCSTGNTVAQSGECEAETDSSDLQQLENDMAESNLEIGASCELETKGSGPPQNGGPHSGSWKSSAEPDDKEEARKRMFYEAAASIVQTVVSAATEQLAKETDILDNSLTCSQSTRNGSYPEIDISYCH